MFLTWVPRRIGLMAMQVTGKTSQLNRAAGYPFLHGSLGSILLFVLPGSLACKFQDGLMTGTDLKLFVNVLEMGADRVDADVHLIGYLFVEASFCQLRQNLNLPLGQLINFYGIFTSSMEKEHHLACDLG